MEKTLKVSIAASGEENVTCKLMFGTPSRSFSLSLKDEALMLHFEFRTADETLGSAELLLSEASQLNGARWLVSSQGAKTVSWTDLSQTPVADAVAMLEIQDVESFNITENQTNIWVNGESMSQVSPPSNTTELLRASQQLIEELTAEVKSTKTQLTELSVAYRTALKEVATKEGEVRDLTASANEMRVAATNLMRQYNEMVKVQNTLETEFFKANEENQVLRESVDRIFSKNEVITQQIHSLRDANSVLESALNTSMIEKDKLALQLDSMRAKSVVYESTMAAVRCSTSLLDRSETINMSLDLPKSDMIDDMLKDFVQSQRSKPFFEKLYEGEYLYHGKRVSITVKGGCLGVKSGEGFTRLEDWLERKPIPRKSLLSPKHSMSFRSTSLCRVQSTDTGSETERQTRPVWRGTISSANKVTGKASKPVSRSSSKSS